MTNRLPPQPFHHNLLAAALIGLAGLANACSRAPEPLAPPPVVPVPEVADVDVTSLVNTALLNAAALQGQAITVVTTKGDVRLTAVLDTQPQIDAALRVTRDVAGVHTVHDGLTLKR